MKKHEAQWYTAAPLWTDLVETVLPPSGQALADEAEAARQHFRRPAILRFANDNFMEDFLALLENSPDRVGELRAFRETWRGPSGEGPQVVKLPRYVRPLELRRQAAAASPNGFKALLARATAPVGEDVFGPVSPVLKLYQPGHMRHYLVSASLVCQTIGLPDRQLDTAVQERVGFVVRRLIPKNPTGNTASPYPADEYAFVRSGGQSGWQKISDECSVLAAEERQPLFPVNYQQVDGRRRRLFSGIIPVGRREAYLGAGELSISGQGTSGETNPQKPGELLFVTQVFEPWKRLIETASFAKTRFKEELNTHTSNNDSMVFEDVKKKFVKTTREQIQTASWLILLDFYRLLQQYLPNVWEHISLPEPASTLSVEEDQVLDKITGTTINYASKLVYLKANSTTKPYPFSAVKTSLSDALVAVGGGKPPVTNLAKQIADLLEKAVGEYNRENPSRYWPDFLFPLADPLCDGPLPKLLPGEACISSDDQDRKLEKINLLQKAIETALPDSSARLTPPPPLAAQSVFDPQMGWFVLRCVMERPECESSLSPAVVSEASEPFQMAGFFDPDAPARPIRINLPVDTTPAGLRKFDKNTAFMISDVLCGQIQRVKGLSLGDLVLSVLPWPLHKDLDVPDGGPCTSGGNTLGMICSLSIPIVTICALILLMIIVNLLDSIFRWLPYFIVCFPLPKLQAKKQT